MNDISTLIHALDLEIGSGEVDSIGLLSLLRSGVAAFNAEAVDEFILDDVLLDREANSLETRAILLWALHTYLKGESNRASRSAIRISNPAGTTDMKNVEWAFAKRRRELLDEEIKPLMMRIKDKGVVSEVVANELGETKDYVADVPLSDLLLP